MFKKHLRRWLPNQEMVAKNLFMRPFAHWFTDPRLWHLNRRSVAGGVAAGAIGGLIPGPLQIITSALLALIFRVNLPVSALMTFYSNPLTIGPLYWLAYRLGSSLIGGNGYTVLPAMPVWGEQSMQDWIREMAAWAWSMGMPLAVGLPALALLLALAGYVLIDQGWRLHVRWSAWRRSKRNPPAQ